MIPEKTTYLILVVILISISSISRAQTDPILEDSNIRPLALSGSVGLTGSTYTASGISNRRAPGLLKGTANLDFSLFGLSSGIDVLYSTDQSGLRQNLNNFSFDASWRWLTVQAGDVSPNFSKYGISGVSIRGGYLQVKPGNWNLELSGGRSRRNVKPSPSQGFREPSFQRITIAGKFGYGSDSDSHIFLSSHYSVDKKNSLNDVQEIAPEENLTVSTYSKIILFDEMLSFSSELTASAYTRDSNSPEIPTGSLGVPSFLTSVFTPRESSRINYAINTTAALNLTNMGLELGYERIQPGFMSLGVGRIRDDQQRIRVSPSVVLLNNDLTVQASVVFGRDNLLDSRLQTQRDRNIATNFQLRVTDMISLNGSYNLLKNDFSGNSSQTGNQPGVALDRKQVAHTVMLQPSVVFQKNRNTHNVSLAGSYFTLSNTFEGSGPSVPSGISSDTFTSSLSYNLSMQSGLGFNLIGNYLVNNAASSKSTSVGVNGGSSYSFFDQKLSLSLNTGINQNMTESTGAQGLSGFNTKSRQLMLNLTGNYRLTAKDIFTFTVRSRENKILEGGQNTFSELEGSFSYRHTF